MPLEQQLTSLIPSQRLEELGIKSDSFFQWECRMGKWSLIWRDYHEFNYIDTADLRKYVPAYSVAELGEMLPEGFTSSKRTNKMGYECFLFNNDKDVTIQAHKFGDTEADARALMLIFLLEKKLIKIN